MTMLVLDLIEQAIDRNLDRTAIVYRDERVTYRELRTRAAALTQYLLAQGVGAERLVCVAIEPSPWAPIAMLAVLQAGAAYVPLDPGYPVARLADMLDQVGQRGTPLVLTTSTAAPNLPPGVGTIVELDRAWPSIAAGAGGRKSPPITPDSLAYVIFTSGSTGRPKGVMVPHRGFVNTVTAQIPVFAIEPESVVLQFAPLSFDASVSEVFTTLVAGATLCLAPRDDLAPGPRLVDLIRAQRVTIATLPPSSLAVLDPADFTGMKTIVSAGEACSAELVARWAPGRRFVNAYGPTEVTVCATMNICRVDPQGRVPGIGDAMSGATVMLLDEQLRPVKDGDSGELYVGGLGVARGYLGRPDLTAQRFLPDPTSTVPGARMYRTGDLARRRDDGELEFQGRADHQVKVRGHRIELGEVEGVLRTAPDVRDVLVLAREDRPGDARLVAYLVGPPNLDRAAVRAAAEARLPTWARPTDLVVLEDWPRSPAGKIDRARLPAPVHAGSARAARSEAEFRLTKIWEDILGVTGIGPDDDFFELGGHSLLAIRMLARVRSELDLDLPVSVVAEHRTLAALAQVVAARGQLPGLRSPVALRNAGARNPLFMVPPISGSPLAYLPLLRRLSAERPFYAFQSPGLDGTQPIETFAGLATHFVEELLAVHPQGPHLIGGWSMGGAVAIEMALQLAERGHEVPTLMMIDATAPSDYLDDGVKRVLGPLDAATFAWMYVHNFGRCFEIDLGLDKSIFRGMSEDERVTVAMENLRRVPSFPPDMNPSRLAAHLKVFAATGFGFSQWRPARRYRGQVVHFVAKDGHPEFTTERADWSPYCERPINAVIVPGNHFSVVNEPHVGQLGVELDRVLDRLP